MLCVDIETLKMYLLTVICLVSAVVALPVDNFSSAKQPPVPPALAVQHDAQNPARPEDKPDDIAPKEEGSKDLPQLHPDQIRDSKELNINSAKRPNDAEDSEESKLNDASKEFNKGKDSKEFNRNEDSKESQLNDASKEFNKGKDSKELNRNPDSKEVQLNDASKENSLGALINNKGKDSKELNKDEDLKEPNDLQEPIIFHPLIEPGQEQNSDERPIDNSQFIPPVEPGKHSIIGDVLHFLFNHFPLKEFRSDDNNPQSRFNYKASDDGDVANLF